MKAKKAKVEKVKKPTWKSKVDERLTALEEKAGIVGPRGPQGPQGDKGDEGDKGETGAKGDKGGGFLSLG